MDMSKRQALGKALRVAVNLAEPWAYADGLCLDGEEVRAIRGYARWCGRELYWFPIPEADLPDALADGRIDVAIGGLCRCRSLSRSAHLVRFGRHRLTAGEPRHGSASAHVWAIRRGALSLWLGIVVYLKLRDRPERFTSRRSTGMQPAFQPADPQEPQT